VLFGPRTGSRDRNFRIPANLPPGPIGELTGVRITQVASLRPGLSASLVGLVNGQATRWREHLETQSDTNVVSTFEDGSPALVSKGRYVYLACWADGALLGNLMSYLATSLDLQTTAMPDFIRLRRAGNVTFAFNYGPDAWTIPGEREFVLGGQEIAPFSLSAWK
jgi:beta-galactosidase